MSESPVTASPDNLKEDTLLYIHGNLYILTAAEGEVRMLREVHEDDREMLRELEGESEEEEGENNHGPIGVRILQESDGHYSEISQESDGDAGLLREDDEYGQISRVSCVEVLTEADDDNPDGEMFQELEGGDLEGEVRFLQEVDDDGRSGSAASQEPELEGEESLRYILYAVERSERKSSQYLDSLRETGLIFVNGAGRSVVAPDKKLCRATTPTVPAVSKPISAPAEGNEEREEVLYVCGRCGLEMPSLQVCRQHMLLEHRLLARDADVADNEETPDGVLPSSNINSPTVVRTPDILSDCGAAEYWLQPRTPREVRSKLCSDRNVRCTVRKCTFRFSCESSMVQHRACHTTPVSTNSKQPPHPYMCPHCEAGYPAWPACSLHLAREHGVALDLLACPLCRTHTTHSVGMMVRHLSTHGKAECRRCAPERPQGQRWYTRKKCQICSKMYANSKSLKKHIQAVHHKLKPFKCNVCGHSSATKNMLLLHMRQHTGEKPYLCEFCPYRTGDLNTRNKHHMRHTGEFPYHCPHCPYRSIQSGSLGSHLRHHHPHLPVPPCSRHPGVGAVVASGADGPI